MRRHRARAVFVSAACVAALAGVSLGARHLAAAPPGVAASAEELARHRNLGKAFYENPTTHELAVAELRRARELAPGSLGDRLNYGLALLRVGKEAEGIAELVAVERADPSLPHPWWNLGIAYEQASRTDEAVAQLEGMVARVPGDAAAHYNLGVLYGIAGQGERALAELETATRLAPDMAAPHYQLANRYRRAGREADAARELARFKEAKAQQADAAVPEDPHWSRFSELVDPVDPHAREAAPAAAVPLRLQASAAIRIDDATPSLSPGTGLAVLDADGDGKPDLLAWTDGRLRLLAGGARLVADPALEALSGVVAALPGDFDNDGHADLCVLTTEGPRLLHREAGRFALAAAKLPAGRFRAAAWLDFDHDYDLDLLLAGDGATLQRNNGDGTWSDATAKFPFARGFALAVVVLDTVAESQGEDVVVSYADHAGVLYRDELGGRFTAEPLPALPAGTAALAAADVDGDGWTDLVAATSSGQPLLLANGGSERRLRAGFAPLPAPAAARAPIVFADLENRGIVDLVAASGAHFGAGGGRFAATVTPVAWQGAAGASTPPAALAAADFDGDGRIDLAALGAGGVRRLGNATARTGRWLAVGLIGVKNLALANGAEVEVKAGTSYEKRRYAGVPLVFGLGPRALADTVRITWPNGLIQNETAQPAGRTQVYKEAPRLSGSCPMIFTWDGRRYRFLTDVLGVAPLGASAGDDTYFPVDHDELVQVPGEALVASDGALRVQVTEELREVSYLDEVHLLALDHPPELEIFTNDKFHGPPFPEFRLFGVRRHIHPSRAVDADGTDVRAVLAARDGRYPTGFAHDLAGVAEEHHLDLDFAGAAPDGRAVLVLSGWVDWADGSTFLGSAQRQGGGLLMPQLQVKDATGAWRTVIEDMGIPAGKPKTIVVDLTDKFLSASREVRIVTNLCVYWDEIFLAEDAADPAVVTSELAPAAADLHYRGFSTPTIDPRRQQPERFDYERVQAATTWNPTPGLYTRYGDVRTLLAGVDDMLVVMGSGDEVSLTFDAAALPPLRAGWRRDFLLLFDGWAKDADANTAYSQSVEPLPFHGMSQYPYAATEHFPDDPEHRRWREETLTRPALRLLRPLVPLPPLTPQPLSPLAGERGVQN